MGRYLKVVPGRAVNAAQSFDEVYLLNDDGTPWSPDQPENIADLIEADGPVKEALSATFVRFVDDNGGPLESRNVVIKVDSTSGEILDIVSEA